MKQHYPISLSRNYAQKARLLFIFIFYLICYAPFCVAQTNSNPYGFEDGTISGFVAPSSSETVVTTNTPANVRTGTYALAAATTSTSSNKYWYTNSFYGASASGTYVHFIYWVKTPDAGISVDASMRYASSAPPSGTGSTANGTAVALTQNTWTQVFYTAGNSNNRWYFPAPRRTNGVATTLYMDDGIIYTASTNTIDLTDPLTPSAVTGVAASGNVNLSWVSNTDAGTGVQATIILRTSNVAATAPDLNDQAVYSSTGGADGPSVIGDWTVISATTGAAATTYVNTGVTNGTYKYAVVLRDLAYNYSTAAVSSPVTVGTTIPPALVVNQTGFTGLFGNVVTGNFSTPQQFTVSGTNLTAAIAVTAPTGFQVSTSSATGYGTSVSVAPVAGVVAVTTIYARYAPTAPSGASGTQQIAVATTGATTQNINVSGNALATEPTTAGTITFGTTATTSVVINLPTVGNGAKRIIIAKQGIAPTFTPSDAAVVAGVNANFTTATDQGGANKVVYDGAGSGAAVVTVTGLTAGTLYFFTVVEYNEGTGTSQNYLASPVVTAATSTAGLPSPAITVNLAGFTGSFGNVVMATNSTVQQYAVSGANLTNDIILTAPGGFSISLAAASGFTNSLTLAQTSGTVATTTIYARYNPAAATGASGSQNITHTSTGATAQNASVNGNAIAIEPTSAGTITFGTATLTSLVLNLPTVGDGAKRIIVARAGAAVSFVPSDGSAVSGVNAAFTTATDQGGGNKIVYDGAGTGSSVVTVTGLSSATTYYFTVYEYNEGTGTSQNYLSSPAATGNTATLTPTPVVTLTTTGFTGAFGNVVTATNSTTQQFTVSGTNLTAGIVITPPSGFQVSTNATSGFGTSLTLTPAAGTVAITPVYVRFSPTAATGATGSVNVSVGSTGVTTQNVTVSGNALAAQPTTAGTITFTNIGSGSMTVNLPTVGNGNKRIIVARQGATPAFIPTDGIAPTGVSSNFSTATDQGGGDKIIYDGAGTGTNVVLLSGLNPNSQYYFAVFEYNLGSGTSQNYLSTPIASGNATTLNLVPVIVVNQTGFTNNFGNVVMATNSATQQYTISGTGLSGNIEITAPTGFKVSASASSGFVNAITLVQSGGTVPATPVYVQYTPGVDNGATGPLVITNTSTGATTQNVNVSGNALSVEPTTAGTITFGNVDDSTIVVNLPTIGGGARRFIVANLGSPAGFVPNDGVAVSGINPYYPMAFNQVGNGRIIYDGTGSGPNVVKMNGLTAGTLYYFTVYEYNVGTGTSHNYLVNPAAGNNMTTSVYVPNGVNNSPVARLIKIYPNPATTTLNIDAPLKIGMLLMDAAGRIVMKGEDVHRIEIGHLTPGYYQLVLVDQAGRAIRTEKILKGQ